MLPERIENAFKQYQSEGNELSKYQKRLKSLILLVVQNNDFSELLDDGSFSLMVADYCNPAVQSDDNLRRWLGILKDPGVSEEDFERNNLRSISNQWVTYLAFTAAEYHDSVSRQKITDDLRQEIEAQLNILRQSQRAIEKIEMTADNLSKSKVLPAYAKIEDVNAKKHDQTARRWLICLVAVVLLLIPIVWIAYTATLPEFAELGKKNDVNNGLQFILNSGLTVKFFIVAAWIFVVRFVSQNYYAEKHLKQVSLHRASVLRSLHAVYENIENPAERDGLIKAGALIAFQPYATGYISRKNGAGAMNTNLMDTLSKK